MITAKRSAFTVASLLVALHFAMMPARARANSAASESGSVTDLSWNETNHEAPFLPVTVARPSELPGQLVYPSGEFSFPLLQSLYHDLSPDCYTLIVGMRRSGAQQIVHLWRAQGFYRTENGPYFELEDSDSLKVVTALSGTRFLFAEVGDGEWHCVSIHDSMGNYLLIDYRADGLISRVRDSLSRTAVPAYSGGRLVSLTQTWTTRSGQRALTTLLTSRGGY